MFLSIPEGVSVATVIIDGVDVAPAGLVNVHQAPGSPGLDPWILRSTRLRWLNNPSGKPQTPCDLGLCKIFPRGKNRRKSVDADFASTAGRHDRHFCESLRPRNPSLLYPGNGITVFTKG